MTFGWGERLAEAAAKVGDSPEKIFCLWQSLRSDTPYGHDDENPPLGAIQECMGHELPEFDEENAWRTQTRFHPMIGYSRDFVYVMAEYDGSAWLVPVARTAQLAAENAPFPLLGGGGS